MTQPDANEPTGLLATYPISEAVFQRYEIPAEDIVEGSPYAEVATQYESPDGKVVVAAARIGVGSYRFRQTFDEINYVTAGHMRIESQTDGTVIDCVPGSVTRMNAGGLWIKTVLEPYAEVAVMTSDEGVQM